MSTHPRSSTWEKAGTPSTPTEPCKRLEFNAVNNLSTNWAQMNFNHWCNVLGVFLLFNHKMMPPAERPTPTTRTPSSTGKTAEGPTLTPRPVGPTSPQWSPRPAAPFLPTAWWASPWTWEAATLSPAGARTWSMGATWRAAGTTLHTRLAPPQSWWATFLLVWFSCFHTLFIFFTCSRVDGVK